MRNDRGIGDWNIIVGEADVGDFATAARSLIRDPGAL